MQNIYFPPSLTIYTSACAVVAPVLHLRRRYCYDGTIVAPSLLSLCQYCCRSSVVALVLSLRQRCCPTGIAVVPVLSCCQYCCCNDAFVQLALSLRWCCRFPSALVGSALASRWFSRFAGAVLAPALSLVPNIAVLVQGYRCTCASLCRRHPCTDAFFTSSLFQPRHWFIRLSLYCPLYHHAMHTPCALFSLFTPRAHPAQCFRKAFSTRPHCMHCLLPLSISRELVPDPLLSAGAAKPHQCKLALTFFTHN